MSKGRVIVIASSVVLMSLFCIFSYLMTTVNPAPINFARPNNTVASGVNSNVTSGNNATRSGKANAPTDAKVAEPAESAPALYLRDFLSRKIGDLKYGIERAESNDWKHFETTELNYFYPTSNKQTRRNYTITEDKKNNRINLAIPILKKSKRRSLHENANFKKEPNMGAVILKILDDIGHTKIEIKVEADAFKENDIKHENFEITEGKPQIYKRENKNRDTIIKILPNNSLSLDKSDQSSFFIDFASNNEVISKINNKSMEIMTNISSTSYVPESKKI